MSILGLYTSQEKMKQIRWTACQGTHYQSAEQNTEWAVERILTAEHAIWLDLIRVETAKDNQLQKLYRRIVKTDWRKHRKHKGITSFFSIRYDLDVMNGLIFRFNQIVVLSCLQHTAIYAAHNLGHVGMTKTKQMSTEMNRMTENIAGKCYECELTTQASIR